MKRIDVEQNTDEWQELRRGKVTGTRLGDLYSPRGTRKIGFYEMLAEMVQPDREPGDRMQRGLDLEDEAAEALCKELNLDPKLMVSDGICVSDVDPRIINSPDKLFLKKGTKDVYDQAAEIKCLSPARHWQAVIENVIPPEFMSQVVQYFIVNEKLEKLYLTFYDPENAYKPLHVIVVTREALGDLPEKYLAFQLERLREVDEIVERYTF